MSSEGYIRRLSGLHWYEAERYISQMVVIEDLTIWCIGPSFLAMGHEVNGGFPWSWSEFMGVLCEQD